MHNLIHSTLTSRTRRLGLDNDALKIRIRCNPRRDLPVDHRRLGSGVVPQGIDSAVPPHQQHAPPVAVSRVHGRREDRRDPLSGARRRAVPLEVMVVALPLVL